MRTIQILVGQTDDRITAAFKEKNNFNNNNQKTDDVIYEYPDWQVIFHNSSLNSFNTLNPLITADSDTSF
jgi:hypothetical protein